MKDAADVWTTARNRIDELHAQLTQAQQERDEACTIARAVGKIENERAKDTMRLKREVAALTQDRERLRDERSVLVNAMNRTVDELRSSVANAQYEERMAKADLATLRAALMRLPKVDSALLGITRYAAIERMCWQPEEADALINLLRLRQGEGG